jgi:phytoene synthase
MRGLGDAGDMELAHLKREAVMTVKALPASIMPVALPATLATDYWRGRAPGVLSKRFRLFWSFVTGRI